MPSGVLVRQATQKVRSAAKKTTGSKKSSYDISKNLQSVNVNKGLSVSVTGADGEVQTIENPLIQSQAVADAVAEWVKGILSNRKTLSGSFRPDPRLDALDLITVTNKYASMSMYVTSVTFEYNGAFTGDYEGRIIENGSA